MTTDEALMIEFQGGSRAALKNFFASATATLCTASFAAA